MKLFSRLLSFFRPRSELYLFGSSILWGQGHLPAGKIDRKVADFIATELGERPSVHLQAHSGALLNGDPADADPAAHGEVPCPWPSVIAQVRAAPPPRAKRVRILMEGGINEVGGVRISSPATPPEYIKRATELACYRDFRRVLAEVAKRFPTAEIYVIGYFQVLAERTGRKDVEDMLERGGMPAMEDDGGADLAERAIENSRLFREQSDHWLRRACEEVETESGPCVFIESGFHESEGMFGRPSLLFHPWSSDPMMGARARQCTVALARRQTGLHCYLAATAHPNEAGIDRYVARITSALRERNAGRNR